MAFFKGYDHKGQLLELLPNGQFFHVAIQIQNQWYHASTNNGVKSIYNLSSLSDESMYIHSMLESKDWDLTKQDIKPYIGLPFDYFYEWECENKTDCTKYIAHLLEVTPTRADFKGIHWSVGYGIQKGGLGISPDELYMKLKQKGFYNISPTLHLKSTASAFSASASASSFCSASASASASSASSSALASGASGRIPRISGGTSRISEGISRTSESEVSGSGSCSSLLRTYQKPR